MHSGLIKQFSIYPSLAATFGLTICPIASAKSFFHFSTVRKLVNFFAYFASRDFLSAVRSAISYFYCWVFVKSASFSLTIRPFSLVMSTVTRLIAYAWSIFIFSINANASSCFFVITLCSAALAMNLASNGSFWSY